MVFNNEGAGEQRRRGIRVGYYLPRWKLEGFHEVLTSGCGIEQLRERSIDKRTTLILMYSIIALMILNMTPEVPCSLLWGEGAWRLLYCCIANTVKKEPQKPYTVKEATETLFPKITWEGRNAHPVTALPE
ncbi:MAG: hypothetical protein LBB80_06385 [Treponema sp.]|jgi:hypothetical protein|nr:hypothetical protein [Treponema sp.]